MIKEELIDFEKDIADLYEKGFIKFPIHLSSGNEDQLIDIFKDIKDTDWVFSTWRSHYHALLHNIPKEKVKQQILDGNSITLCFPEHNFYTSAIVGGIIPIALGVAASIKLKLDSLPVDVFEYSANNQLRILLQNKHVYCFIGDMTANTGIFKESYEYAVNNNLPITFIIEDNQYSVGTPTIEAQYSLNKNKYLDGKSRLIKYKYTNQFPHSGVGKFVAFSFMIGILCQNIIDSYLDFLII
jgi:pyruvate dehydrogenase E1 component alpha subunit